MGKNRRQRRQSPIVELVIVTLLFVFCILVMWWRIDPLYDLVRTCITAILVAYLGWRVLSKPNRDQPHQREDALRRNQK
jgi:membrane protein implicated in regulation of membrane protease activity